MDTLKPSRIWCLWKPLQAPQRFVFAITSRGPIVLMCSDLNLSPQTAIALYCARGRVEALFSMLKHLRGAFPYRFWSKRLPRHSRKPKKHTALKAPKPEHVNRVHITWPACERFVMWGGIALGLLQVVALKFPQQVWQGFNLFRRTRSRALPSERTVKVVLGQEIARHFRHVVSLATMPIIASEESPHAGMHNDPEQAPLKAVNA
jgi:hypothetical protein